MATNSSKCIPDHQLHFCHACCFLSANMTYKKTGVPREEKTKRRYGNSLHCKSTDKGDQIFFMVIGDRTGSNGLTL